MSAAPPDLEPVSTAPDDLEPVSSSVSPPQQPAQKPVSPPPDTNPPTNKDWASWHGYFGMDKPDARTMRAVNSAFLANQLGMKPDQIESNYQGYKDSYAKNVFGGDVKPGMSDASFYSQAAEKTGAKGSDKTVWDAMKALGIKRTSDLMWNIAWMPAHRLPEAPKNLNNFPWMGLENPALMGAVYNAVFKPFVESTTSPAGIATMAVSGPLKLAGEASVAAKAAMMGIGGLFGGVMAKQAYDMTPETKRVMNDPNSSFQDKATAIGGQAATALMAIAAPLGAVLEAKGSPLGPEELKGKTPGQAADIIRSKIPDAPMDQVDGLKTAADAMDKVHTKQSEAAQAWDEVKQVLAPQNRAMPEEEGSLSKAKITAGSLREHGADLAQRTDRATAALESASKSLMKLPMEERLDFIDRVENGEEQPNKDLQAAHQGMRDILDTKREEIRALGTGKLENFIEDYFPHIWKDPEEAADAFKKAQGKAPIEGSKAFLKQRTIPTTREGMALGLEPVSTNPVDLVLLKAREMDKYLLGQKWLAEMKDREFVKPFENSDDAPAGWSPINDPIAKAGRSRYYAPNEIATVANNYLSPGLRKFATYRGYMALSNSLNQFQLGLSAFHLGFTSLDTSISKLALSLEYAKEGNLGKAVKEGAKIPFAPVTNAIQGDRVLKEWMKPGSQGEEIGKIADAVRQAGGRAKMDQFYQTTITKQMQEMFSQKTLGGTLGGIWRIPFAAMEKLSKPLMEYLVPRQKLGVAADLMRKEMENHPNMTQEQARAAFGKAWDSVDNRMGQLVYDNLFWHKTAKDLAMASVRSVGWDLGTLRELGGGLVDTAKFVRDLAKDQPKAFGDVAEFKATQSGMGVMPDFDLYNLKEDLPGHPKDSTVSEKTLREAGYELDPKQKAEFTHRMAYMIALPVMTGAIGATYQYLKTGKGPGELRDYFFPKTGEKDPQGRDVRLALPSYMKDVYHYAHAPLATVEGKVSPFPSLIMEMLNNKDFFGRDIRHSDDPLVKQMMDEATFFAKSYEPIGIRQFAISSAANQSAGEKASNFVGVTRAPAWVGETDAEQLAGKLAGDKFKSTSSPDSELVQKKQNILSQIRNGGPAEKAKAKQELSALVDSGQITSVQKRNLLKGTDHSYLENAVSHLDANEAMRVFRQASPAERESIEREVRHKVDTAHLPKADKQALKDEFKSLLGRDIDTTNR